MKQAAKRVRKQYRMWVLAVKIIFKFSNYLIFKLRIHFQIISLPWFIIKTY